MKKKILYVFRTPRNHILIDTKKGLVPNSMLFGLNHLREFGYQVDFLVGPLMMIMKIFGWLKRKD